MTATLTPCAKTAHATAARALCDTLTVGGQDAFAGLSVILRAKLSPVERRALAWAALRACDDDEVAEVILPPQSRAGSPLAPFDDVVGEAAVWASFASAEEIQAYLVVCFDGLSPGDQADFLAFAQSRRRAA